MTGHAPRSCRIPELPLASVPWWAWGNVLALDAPWIAVAWARLAAHSAHVTVPAAVYGALGALVWTVYLADRWLDTRHPVPDGLALRHRFWIGRRGVLAALVASSTLAASASAMVALFSDTALAAAASPAAAGTVAHMISAAGRRRWPNNISVAAMFSLGVFAPVLAAGVRPLLPMFSFALLVAVNCHITETGRMNLAAAAGLAAVMGTALIHGWQPFSGGLLATTAILAIAGLAARTPDQIAAAANLALIPVLAA